MATVTVREATYTTLREMSDQLSQPMEGIVEEAIEINRCRHSLVSLRGGGISERERLKTYRCSRDYGLDLTMEERQDYARLLRQTGSDLSAREIARRTGLDTKTVQKYDGSRQS